MTNTVYHVLYHLPDNGIRKRQNQTVLKINNKTIYKQQNNIKQQPKKKTIRKCA